MIQCNSFELVYLRKIPYLIPYGQQTANLQKSVRLNETGVLIWNGLSQKKPLDQILQDILNTYELSESDRPFVQEDLYETITFLFVSVLLRFAVKDKIFLRYQYFSKISYIPIRIKKSCSIS